jgi:hypothetical protein
MKHEMQVRYPASSAVVLKMFTDKGFHTTKLEAMGVHKYKILQHQFDGQNFSIRIERQVPMQAPALVRKLVPMEPKVTNEESWNVAAKSGKVRVEPQGMPVEMSCTMSMADKGKECVVSCSWEIRARVPLLGGALEKFILGDLERRSAEETEAGIALLKNYR